MLKRKTHFEQVPIEIVRTILKQQSEPYGVAVQPPGVDGQVPEENLFEVTGYPARGARP
jgi:hypothetical protein